MSANLDEQLSEHFTLGELLVTEHRTLLAENRSPPLAVVVALRALARTTLEPIRQNFGAALIVHSGYRCRAVNEAVGGSITSQHMKGEAADFHIVGVSLRDVFDWIRIESSLPYGQVILEPGTRPAWIHVSLGEPYRVRGRCRQALLWTPGPDGGSYASAAALPPEPVVA